MKNEGLYSDYSEMIIKNNNIESDMFVKYNVKRGLRNTDGTGVLVGLTEVGDVHAYIMDENEKVPVEGRLRYRGIDIFDLVKGFQDEKRLGFEECVYLLLFGELPGKQQLDTFSALLDSRRKLPRAFTEDMILKAPSKDIMNKLARAVLASYSYDPNPDDTSVENTLRQCIDLIARFPAMAAYGYQAKSHYHDGNSLFLHSPKEGASTAENILHMIRPDCSYTRSEVEILDLLLVLHAEHGGGNNSTFATRVVSSSGTDTYSAIAAAIGSLKGPKHGGANIKVMQMMENIKANVKNWSDEGEVGDYLIKILNREANDGSGLIYGVGHAVYTLSDPRGIVLKKKAQELAKETGNEEEYNLFTMIEKLSPEVFARVKRSDKVVSANVDFYSGFVYKSLGIPHELYTPLFAISRIAGWSAHLLEEIINGGRIIRPAYKNVLGKVAYTPMKDR